MKHFNRTVTVLVFIFLYIPMIVLAVASFNTGTDIASFKGFTLRQYANLFRDGTLLTLLRNSVIIALLATLISTRNLSSRFMYNPRLRSFIWDVSKLHPSPAREIFILYLSVIVLTPAKRIAVNHYKLNGTAAGNAAFIDLYGFTLEVTYNGII